MAQVPLTASAKTLDEQQFLAVREWLDEQPDEDWTPPTKGLWVCGPRRSGTTYAAAVAMRRMVIEHGYHGYECVDAFMLTQEIRNLWLLGDQMRSHPDDYGINQEWLQLTKEHDYLWQDCSLVWFNDFDHEAVDVKFWRRHVFPHLERRVKSGKPTVVSTTLDPDHPALTGLEKVITDLFVICACVPFDT